MEFRKRPWVRAFITLTAVLPLLATVFGVAALMRPDPTRAAQSIPYKVNFQGRLTDNSGNILTDGLYNIKFKLYDAAAAGTLKYSEDRLYTGATPGPAAGAFDNRVQITNGLFNIQFGDVTVLSTALFSGAFPLYLEVELPTPASATCASVACAVFTEGPMTPRQPLASSPYAFNSDTLDGLDSSSFAQLTSANTYTAAQLFAPGASAVVALTVKASTGGATNSLEVFDSAGVRQAFFSPSGALNLAQTIQPTTNNTTDIGLATTAFKSVYAATFDTGTTTTALTIGASNAASITIGKAGVVASLPGGITTSGGTINTGTGSITTTGALSGGVITGTSLGLGSGNLTTTGTVTATSFTGSGAGLTSLNPTNLVTGSGAVTLQAAASAALNLTATGTTTITVTPGSGGITNNFASGVTDRYTTTAAQTADLVALSNTAAFAPTVSGNNLLQGTYFGKPATGNTASAARFNVTNANAVAAGQVQGIRLVVTGAGGAVASDTVGLLIDPLATPSTGSTAENAIEIGSGWDAGIFIQSGGNTIQTSTDTQFAFTVKNAAGTRILTVDTESAVDPLEVQVGQSSVIDAIQVNLGLDSSNQFADQGTCTTTSNQGAMYYNTASAAIRSCINGSWEDLITTGGLGLIAYGVIPDSGTGAGDLGGISSTVNGPCRVSFATTTTVTIVQGCTAYSGGRKVVIPNGTVPTGTLTLTNNNFVHVCLNGTNGQPAFSTSGTETATNQPTFSVNNPVVCLADIKTTNTAIANIYDVRTFTNSPKTFVTTNTAVGLGYVVIGSATANLVAPVAVASSVNIKGVIVAYSGTISSTAINAIIVTGGPVYVKGTTGTANNYVTTSATSGYAVTTNVALTTAYAMMGLAARPPDTLCNGTTNCQFSQFINPMLIR